MNNSPPGSMQWLRALLRSAVAVAALASAGAHAVDWSQPHQEPQDTLAAAAETDEYAWRLFVALNCPAAPAQRAADPGKKLGALGEVVWETWKNANDVFLPDGSHPGPWVPGAPASAAAQGPARRFDALPLQQQIQLRGNARQAERPADRAVGV